MSFTFTLRQRSNSRIPPQFYRHVFSRCAGGVVTQLAFLLEGGRAEELPEQCLGVAHLSRIGQTLARPLPPA
jgi:hypothetical protein